MKIDNLTVEIEESKRFNKAKSGVVTEVFRKSDKQRTAEDGRVYNRYTGTIVVAEADDLSGCDTLARKIKADLYPDDERSAAECLADVLNNGGLRLAYGDSIKSQYKLGGTANVLKIKMAYMEHLAKNDVATLSKYVVLSDEDKTTEAVKWYNARNA